MPVNPIHGSDLALLANSALAGYQNAVDQELIYSFLNEGKNEIWMALKEEKANYFVVQSQNTNSSNDFFFPKLSQTAREYDLPSDFHEMRLVEVNDVGFEDVRFEWRSMSSIDFQEARRGSTNQPSGSGSAATRAVYYWDVVGKKRFVLAQFPEIPFNFTFWYVRIIPDFGPDDAVDEILYPFSQKISEFAVQKITLALQDQGLSEEWRKQFRESIVRIASSAAPRQSANPIFVSDFVGYTIES